MNHLNPGLLGAYNSLTDKHLTGYFNNTRIRRHLQKVGLLSRSGRIIPEKEYRHKLIQRAHQRHIRECLAQAIFHKVLDMERLHQIEIKRKLEEFARRERVHKIKVERSNRYDEDPIMMLSPRPPTGPKNSHARHSGPEVEHSESTESPGSSRPNTAPGKMQRPVRLKPLNSTSTPGSLKRNSSRYRHQDSSNETDHPFSSPLERDAARPLTLTDFSSTVSPYRLPVINNFVTPVPPLTKKKEKGPKGNGTLRGRRLRPTTAPSAADTQEGGVQQVSAQSSVSVKMVYFGKSVHLSHDLMDLRDEVKVFQQHCGGENLCVYKGRLTEGETFQFVSRRHRGFPFSLTFFLNGLQVERLSSCCEFKHRKGSRLGGRHGHFGFTGVAGASPCYRCIIAMGLDKKPTPPKRVKEDPLLSTSRENSKEEDEKDDLSQPCETKGDATQEKLKNDYEEDFEADDEGPVEDAVDEATPSPIREEEEESGKKDENENSLAGKNRDSDSEAGDSEKNKVKQLSSVSTGLSSSSSSSPEDESEEGPEPGNEEEVPEENVKPERRDSTLTSEKDTKLEDMETMDTSSVSLPQQTEEESQTRDSFIEKSDMEISEDTEKGDGEGEKLREAAAEDQVKDEDKEVEPEKAKSVQEKLAEAILNVADCSSEPELSDTTTEEDEVSSVKTQQDGPGAEPETSAAQPPSGEQEELSKENTTEPAPEAKTVEGDADTQQPAENQTHETSQLEPKAEKEEVNVEDTDEKQKEEKYEQPVVEEQNKSAVPTGEIDEKEQQDVGQEENRASEDPEEAGQEMIAETEESKESTEPETEAESENITNAEVSGEPPEEEPELTQTGEKPESTDVIAEPQSEDPGETAAAADTESVSDANNTNQDTEIESQEQPESAKNGEGTGEEASAEDKVIEEVRPDEEEEAVGEVDEEEKDGMNEKEGEKMEGTERPEEGNLADEDRAVEVEKDEEIIQDDMQQELSEVAEASEANLEITEEGNMSEEKPVEDKVDEADDAANAEEQKQAESTLVKEAEAESTDKDSKDANHDEPEEAAKETESVKEEEVDGGGMEKAEDDDGETESAVQKDPEAEVKDTESVKEDNPEDEEQPAKVTELKDLTGVAADEVENSAENHDNTGVNSEENVEVSLNKSGEEKTEDGGGGNEAEVEEEVEGTNMEEAVADQDPEEVEAGNNVAEETKEAKDDEERVKEEMSENSASQEEQTPAHEGISEVSETVSKPDEVDVEDNTEKPEDNETEGHPESAIDKAAEQEGENKSGSGVDNVKPEEEGKDDESIKEKETEDEGHPEEQEGAVEDMDAKGDGEENAAASRDHAEIQEGEENDKLEQKEVKEPPVSDDLQEATMGGEENSGEMDNENGKEVIVAEGEIEKEQETPAKPEEAEATFVDRKEEIIQTEIEQDTPAEEDKTNEQEADKEEEEETVSNNADVDAEVPPDAKTAAEEPAESEMKATDKDPENRANVEGEDQQAGLPAPQSDKQDGAAEDASEEAEGSTSSASPSEESQPADKVMALKREDRESTFSEDGELLASPPAEQGDLVSNWVNIHQASRYFETFVEPLDDIKSLISHEGERNENGEPEETKLSTKDSESGGVDQRSETAKDEQARSDLENLEDTLVENFKMETKPEALESDLKSESRSVSEDRGDMEAKDLVSNTESLFTAGEQKDVPADNIINLSETSVVKFEISQDS